MSMTKSLGKRAFSDSLLDNNGYLYVSDTHKHRIRKFTIDGRFVLTTNCTNLHEYGRKFVGVSVIRGKRMSKIERQKRPRAPFLFDFCVLSEVYPVEFVSKLCESIHQGGR